MPRTKQRTPELAERVLAVAVDLLAEEGAAGLTARSLAARARRRRRRSTSCSATSPASSASSTSKASGSSANELAACAETADPVADLWAFAAAYRRFIRANRELAEVMFSRPVHRLLPRT